MDRSDLNRHICTLPAWLGWFFGIGVFLLLSLPTGQLPYQVIMHRTFVPTLNDIATGGLFSAREWTIYALLYPALHFLATLSAAHFAPGHRLAFVRILNIVPLLYIGLNFLTAVAHTLQYLKFPESYHLVTVLFLYFVPIINLSAILLSIRLVKMREYF